MAADEFLHSREVQTGLLTFHMMGGKIVGAPAANWWLLEFFTVVENQLRDLHVLQGSDSKPWTLAKAFGVKLPKTFSYYADN
jgi:hypothetical protein